MSYRIRKSPMIGHALAKLGEKILIVWTIERDIPLKRFEFFRKLKKFDQVELELRTDFSLTCTTQQLEF